MLTRIHLDALGGIAGDMFVAALADAFPDRIDGVLAELGRLAQPEGAAARFAAHRGGALTGRRFVVESPHAHEQHHHDHAAWRDIRARLQDSQLAPGTKRHALAIFALLADAEAQVHGIAAEAVEFHEVGAWDSIADIVAAAHLIDALAPECWTWSPLPLGSGRVRTQHGVLPVPAPAAALLLRGMETLDDGIAGERVTPTGAAILRHLLERGGSRTPVPGRLSATGIGFGTRELEGVPNIVRCLAIEAGAGVVGEDRIATLQFEIDDQTLEDLGIALERLRLLPGVLEVYQAPVYGKKGRLAIQVQVLARPEAAQAVADACFEETTTLGLRIGEARRRVLRREEVRAAGVRVKLAERPSGARTAKAESEDVSARAAGRAAREEQRRAAEDSALQEHGSDAGKHRD